MYRSRDWARLAARGRQIICGGAIMRAVRTPLPGERERRTESIPCPVLNGLPYKRKTRNQENPAPMSGIHNGENKKGYCRAAVIPLQRGDSRGGTARGFSPAPADGAVEPVQTLPRRESGNGERAGRRGASLSCHRFRKKRRRRKNSRRGLRSRPLDTAAPRT